jgi:hypothetical protein
MTVGKHLDPSDQANKNSKLYSSHQSDPPEDPDSDDGRSTVLCSNRKVKFVQSYSYNPRDIYDTFKRETNCDGDNFDHFRYSVGLEFYTDHYVFRAIGAKGEETDDL